SFGGAVAVRAGIVLGDDTAGGVTLATQSAGCEEAERLARTPGLLFHGANDEIPPPPASGPVQMVPGGGLGGVPGSGHRFGGGGGRWGEVGEELGERLGAWIRQRFC